MKLVFRTAFARRSPLRFFLVLLFLVLVVQNIIFIFVPNKEYEAHVSSIFLILIAILAYITLMAIRKREMTILNRLERLRQARKESEFRHLIRRLDEENHLLIEYKNAVDLASIVSKTNLQGKLTYVNENFCKVSGFSKEELLGMTQLDLMDSGSSFDIYESMWRTVNVKQVWHGRFKNRTKDGGYYIVNAMVAPILDEQGEIQEFISIREDVTEFVELGHKLELERLEKSQKELAAKSAEEISKAKDAFLIMFTHELKTPLNAIINFSNFIAKKLSKLDIEGKEQLVELANGVRTNGESMLSVVTNILDIGRLRTNKLSFSLERFDMGALIREVVQMNSSLMESKGVKVSVNIEDGIYIKSDKQRVGQIVTNLYSNAIKYGNGQILIELARSENGFALTIEDNGRGVADKIGAFELFNTADSDLVRSSGGTGVGLNFAKLLSRGLGFELILDDSKKLGGAKFALFGKLSGSEKGVS